MRPIGEMAVGVTAHHDRARAVLLVPGLEADRRSDSGENDETDLLVLPVRGTARVTRIQARLDEIRPRPDRGPRRPDSRTGE